jgi:UDP-N-acetylglucosamine--N-acetylmuramyl-(pentapeptide) pyrophosphoryl-undecaprenol N-acetylglucosamine transferase
VRIAIAGGGTGGHLFPGIAIAEEFLKRDPQSPVIFIGTKRGIEHRLLGPLGYELKEIDVEGLKGRGIKALIKGVYAIPNSMLQSRRILADFRPDVVIGVGGYASGADGLSDGHSHRHCRTKRPGGKYQPHFGEGCPQSICDL